MTPAQEHKLDEVLKLTAQHTVLLAGLKEWLQSVATRQTNLERKVIHLEATREDPVERRRYRLAGLSALLAAGGLLTSIAVAIFK